MHAPTLPARAMRAALALAVAAGVLAACQATRVGDAETFEEAVQTYRVSDEKKALVLAADEQGRRVWGAQYGSLDQDRADADAMKECEDNARRGGIQAQCYPFAVGDREARSTLEGCRAKRINPKRCAAQAKFGPLLLP